MYGEVSRPFKLSEGRDSQFVRDVEETVHTAVPAEDDFKVTSTNDKIHGRVRSFSDSSSFVLGIFTY